MARLNGVIFGADNVLARMGDNDFSSGILTEVGRLVQFLRKRNIQTVVISNHRYCFTDRGPGGTHRPAQEYLQQQWGVPIRWFHRGEGEMPAKQTAAALAYVRAQFGWEPNETLFIGNSQSDMQSATNGGVLLLNAEWFGRQMDYGFIFPNPKEIARFIDVFCLREHLWFWRIESGGLRVYALAPYGTKVDSYREYSKNFIEAVKEELGDDGDFWAKYLCTSLYFSGLYDSINYVTSYPGHLRNDYPQVLNGPLTAFAKCFRRNYVPDLIIRHTDAPESKRNRDAVNHLNQLNTIHLEQNPLRQSDERYKTSPLSAKKTVLVIDDICTKGFSFEAARAYVAATRAGVVCVSLLKTLNRDYEALGSFQLANGPYQPNGFAAAGRLTTYGYRPNIVDAAAPEELLAKLKHYHRWDWPN
jgi:hypothetical protein